MPLYSSRMKLSLQKGLDFSEFDSEEPPSGRESAIYIFLAAKFKSPGFGIQVGLNISHGFSCFKLISFRPNFLGFLSPKVEVYGGSNQIPWVTNLKFFKFCKCYIWPCVDTSNLVNRNNFEHLKMRIFCCSEDLESPDPGYPTQSGNYTPSKKVRFKGRGQCRRVKGLKVDSP